MLGVAAKRHRINRVINHVRSRSSYEIGLDELADVACLSKYHFSRVFRDCLDETPIEHLWRVRTEQAARDLVFSRNKPITDIAMDCGFSSAQTFSRSFRHRFGMSPKSFRATPLRASNPSLTKTMTNLMSAPLSFETMPEYRVAYVRHFGPYGDVDGRMSAAFRRLKQWAKVVGIWDSCTGLIGFCPDNKYLTPAIRCVYDICIPVPDGLEEDDLVSIQTIPAGAYAVLDISGRLTSILSSWEWLASEGLSKTDMGYELLWSYEYYPISETGHFGPEVGVRLCQRIDMNH